MRISAMTSLISAAAFCALSAADIQPILLNGDPHPTSRVSRQIVRRSPELSVILDNVPTSRWAYGCAATSAGMMFGYYDRTDYPDMYTGWRNEGVAPLRNLGHITSLVASRRGRDKNLNFGHVNDYWISYGSTGPDPFLTQGREEHSWDCVADFLGTNQWKWDFYGSDGIVDFNIDGSTALWAYSSSAEKLYDYIPPASMGLPQTSLCHGLKLFAESRGYSVSENYTQRIDALVEDGFSFEDFKVEIDSARPVMIQLQGHSMVGVGYSDADSIIYIHDTWDNRLHWMEWGGSYAGMPQVAVTVLHLDEPPVSGSGQTAFEISGRLQGVPEPATIALFLFGGLLTLRFRRVAER